MGISFFEEKVDVDEENILHKSPDLLKILLRDRTTGRNIVWATKTYELLGKEFKLNETIKIKSITGKNAAIIRPRVEKLKYEQKERTKGKAEVFTPSWIVKKQGDVVDKEFENLPLEEYITKTWLEITCGEAPYMVNRYDMITGNLIPLTERAGFVDRKLRRINQEVNDEESWLDFAKKAYQASYGYEFQGDSLLLARENLLYTFIDYYQEKFGKHPDIKLQIEIAKIISYNVFQMDGLKYTVPFTETIKKEEDGIQLNLFGETETAENNETLTRTGTLAKIKNWHNNKILTFQTLKEDGKMKFDVVIGNPPYQDETVGENKTFAPPIYNKFMDATYVIAEKVILISPARFLFNAGSTPSSWNKKMLNDEHLKVIKYVQKSTEVFPNTDIKGGIAITYRDNSKYFGRIDTFTIFPELNSILKKVESLAKNTIKNIISGRGVYKLSEFAHIDFPEIEDIQSKGHKNDIGSGAFKIMKNIIFFHNKPLDKEIYVKILGLENGKRVYYWMNKKYLNAPSSFKKFKVIMPQANGNGSFGEPISSPIVLRPYIGATETFLSIGEFDTEYEAEAVLKYIKSKFARALLGILKITQANTKEKWAKVPLQDFTPDSDIDWSKSIPEIDQQLYKKYGLNQEEINFIETKVKEMA
ncbi:Eco57I restriction-modification methylase domain-containing protein [Enterococcus faecium]|nr:restriction endonuclease [Enterococcus faecium]EME3523936.1 Eco57I restriction-modification methylase domain-containing protein [Enterococcus faecium]